MFTSLTDVAWAAGGAGKLNEAETLERAALAHRRKILGGENPDVSKSLYQVGDRLRQRGDLPEAYAYLSAALSMQLKLLGNDNMWTLDTKHSLGLTLVAEGKLPEAEQMHREALASWRKRGDAEIPQALVELEGLTRVLVAEKKYGDAEQFLNEWLTPAFVKEPASAKILSIRADLFGRQGRWQEAAADTAAVFEHQPGNNVYYSPLAALLVKTHNRSAYEDLRQRLLTAHADTTNIFVADQVAKACLFLPASKMEQQEIDRLADVPVKLGAGDEGALPFFQVGKALSEYRQGHFAEAAEWSQKSIENPRVDAHAHAYAILAMADWQLGQKDEARAMLTKGEDLAPSIMPERVAEDPEDAWMGWLFARIQLDEATGLFQSGSTIDTQSNAP